MKRFFLLLTGIACLIGTTSASAAETGRLLRSTEQAAVYYTLPDGRRFAFPNERIFRSWFSSFTSVETVSPGELAQARLAGAVLYHPGRLIKITSDPKVYLVAQNGELRWIETEVVAQSLFGMNWASQVEDISDAFFASYHFGSSIRSASDVALNDLVNGTNSATIAANQNLLLTATTTIPTLPTMPTSTTSSTAAGDIVIRTSLMNGVRVNEAIRIDVYAENLRPQNLSLRVNGLVVASCQATVVCSYTFTQPTQSSITSYAVIANGTFSDGTQREKTLTIPVRDPQAGALRLQLSQTESRPQGNVDIRAEWSDPLVRASKITLTVNGQDQKLCFNMDSCSLSYGIDSPASTTLMIGATADDSSGQHWVIASTTLSIVSNERPTVTTGVDATTVFTGEAVTVNALANDPDAIAFIEIWANNERVARCERPSCSYTSAPQTTSGSVRFQVIAQDLLGARRVVDVDPVLVLPAIR